MVIASLPQERLTPAEVAKLCGVNLSTVNRWMKTGVRGIRLKFACIGKRRYISPEMLNAFLEGCSAAAQGTLPHSSLPQQAKVEAAMSAIESL
jgi:hypothetical protein